jgi:multidrug efflux pump subunit AcrB
MTLGGLAAAVGLVIDDAIVVVENIVLHRDSGQSRGEAIRSALREIRLPLLGSTITPIVVFLPLITITGVTGTFFRALAITVGTALLTSLGLALTWTPTLSHYLLRSKTGSSETTSGFMRRILGIYDRALRFVLAYPLVLAAASAGLIVVSYFCYGALGSDLLPEMDEGSIVFDYLMPAGSSLADTNAVLMGVEKMLVKIPDIASYSRRTGLQLGLAAVTEANTGDFLIKLKRGKRRPIEEVISELRKKVGDEYPQLDVEFAQVLQDQIGDLTSSPEPIEVKLFSQNPELLKQWAPKVSDRPKKISVVKDLKNGIENTITGPAIVMRVNQAVAARAGFTPQEIELDASALLQGEPATTPVIVNDHSYTIRVRFPENVRTSLEQIKNTMITSTSTGKAVTLGSVTDFSDEPGQTEIRRENLQRYVGVTGRFEGVSLGAGMDMVRKAVADMGLPATVRVVYGGLYAEQRKSFQDLLVVLVLAVVLVFTVLLFEFGNFAAPVAILASALLSTSGVFLALLITRTTFNISSFMGLIMVVGIVAKNGILLLDADQRFRAQGSKPRDAMIEAGERRLRPIMMTALATIAGMIPLSLAIGAGSQMLQPLAIAVIGGVLASMVLSLLVTPAVHYYLGPRE